MKVCKNHPDKKMKAKGYCGNCYYHYIAKVKPNFKENKSKYFEKYYEKNKEEIKAYHRETNSERYEKNKDYIKKKTGEYQRNNRARSNALIKKYKLKKINQTPNWLTKEHFEQILEYYIESQRLTKETGIRHEVDHIVPIQGKNVSGLHVPWNLQILTNIENRKKSNKLKE